MTIKSLGNPFDGDRALTHSKQCGCTECKSTGARADVDVRSPILTDRAQQDLVADGGDSEAMLDRAIESAVVRSVFGHNDHSRRSFMKMIGRPASAAALIASVFPMEKAKAAVKESMGKL